MPIWLSVLLGGALGSVTRHGVNVAVTRVAGRPGPYATVIVNILGCAIIGGLAGLIAAGHLRLSNAQRAFVFVGVLGGLTTFSSFALDTLVLVQDGRVLPAAINVGGQVAVGLIVTFAAYAIAAAI
jgi:CrcB protein